MFILSILFFVTAILYSSVGFGGGSTYLALLLIWGIPYSIFPLIALICNIFVVSGNCFNYIRAGNLNFRILSPFLIGSLPLAYFGGTLQINKDLFEVILFIVLGIAGLLLLINFNKYEDAEKSIKKIPIFFSIIIGSIIGFISSLFGIGGGIFLSPIMFLVKADKAKNIVTGASLFILLNSISGILGHLSKNYVFSELSNYWPLFLMVIIGGQLGNLINLKKLSSKLLTLITAVLVLFVSIRIGVKIFF